MPDPRNDVEARPKTFPVHDPPLRACIECVMAWLLYGDGAECLMGHGLVYMVGGDPGAQ
jgi:hypothetical protein